MRLIALLVALAASLARAEHVLVTGAAGFIGSHVAEALLRRGALVTALDNFDTYYDVARRRDTQRALRTYAALVGADQRRYGASPLRFIEGDVTDVATVAAAFAGDADFPPVDAVIHLAARPGVRTSIATPLRCVHTNVFGTAVVFNEAVARNLSHVVYASSSSVYGVRDTMPFREDDRVDEPASPYAASKAADELLAYAFAHVYGAEHGTRFTGLRFFTVYGPRGRPDMAPLPFLYKIAHGLPITLYGDGTTARSYTFIPDIVDGVLGALARTRGKANMVYNIGGDRTVSLSEFVAAIERVTGRTAIVERVGEQNGDVPVTSSSSAAARRDFGFEPRHSLEEGLRLTHEWLRGAGRAYVY